MADTIAIANLPRAMGVGMKLAAGTAKPAFDGSFAVSQKGPGSKALRNIVSVIVNPTAGSVKMNAFGSSDGYIHVRHKPVGTPIPTSGTTDLVLNFVAFAAPGTLPA